MARSAYIRTPLIGLEGITAVLRGLPAELQASIMTTAMGSAARPIQRHAKQFAERSRRTGALKDSITFVVRKYRGGLNAAAIIGPDKRSYRDGQRIKPGANLSASAKPHKYAHLVEFGHFTVEPKAGTTRRKRTARVLGFVAARPFMRPAVAAGQHETGESLAAGLAKGIEKTRARLVKAGTHAA